MNKMYCIKIVALTILSLMLTNTYAADCNTLSNLASNLNLGDDFQNVKTKLGPATKQENFKETKYKWDNYSLTVRNDGTKYAKGKLPNKKFGTPVPNLTEVVAILGLPNDVNKDNLTKYEWQCPSSVSTLTVLTDSNFKILSYTKSGEFYLEDNNKQINANTSLGSTEMDAVDLESLQSDWDANYQTMRRDDQAKSIETYNQIFNTSFTNSDIMRKDMINRIKQYYAALRQCKPGDYQYAMPSLFTIVTGGNYTYSKSSIKGMNGQNCLVENNYSVGSPSPETQTDYASFTCNYSPKTLSYFTDAMADAGFNFTSSTADNPEFNNAMMTECKDSSVA